MAVGAPGRSFDRPAEGERRFWPGTATGTERRLNTGRYESGRDWTAYGARTTAPSPEYRADAGKPALRRAHAVGRAMPGAGGEGKKGMSQAWRLYPQSHCPPPEGETRGTGGKTIHQANVQTTDEESVEVSPVFLSPLCSRISRK